MPSEGTLLHAALVIVLQLATVFAVTFSCGRLMRLIGQSPVLGEIAGGLLLGPLCFGALLPRTASLLFAPSHMQALEAVSNIGLVLFLFVIGSELDLGELRNHRGKVLAITAGSIVVPFAMGAGIAPLLWVTFEPPHGTHGSFIAFLGVAMSITALPVLARILEDRRAAGHPVEGTIANYSLLSAAANDLVAWSYLAVVLAVLHARAEVTTMRNLVVLVVFVAAMLLVVRPAADALATLYRKSPLKLWIPALVLVAFGSAHTTDALGIHAFFGAFLAGLCVPHTKVRGTALSEKLTKTLRPVIQITLPVFFVLTGLRMQRSMFSWNGLEWLAVILLVAVVGKIGGAALAARLAGLEWHAASRIGILMNTRGLVELIALNIGYREGILNAQLFTLFVLMAIVTTSMTVPLLQLTERYRIHGR